MKKLLVVAIAVFMMAGTSAAAEFNTGVVADNAAATVQQQNVVEKMIALIKNYTTRSSMRPVFKGLKIPFPRNRVLMDFF